MAVAPWASKCSPARNRTSGRSSWPQLAPLAPWLKLTPSGVSVVITGPISRPNVARQPSTTCRWRCRSSGSMPPSSNNPSRCRLTGLRPKAPVAKRFKAEPSTYWMRGSLQ